MQAIFLVLKQTELVDKIMTVLFNAGIHGATAIDSVGMANTIAKMNENTPMVHLLRGILAGEDDSHKSKTLFVVVNDEQAEIVKTAIRGVTGDLAKPNAGIMFGIPVSFAEGIS
ncbi:MAG: hypothetical protein K6B74_12730 [Ruminococcus sp.]|nr:hypothetical protein [Ruminococcus sp.]